MNINTLLTPQRTLCQAACTSKKRAIETLSELIAAIHESINAEQLFHQIIERERLGSTGIGAGIAIPHCRFDTQGATIGALMTLATPIDFDAIDNKPVDIVFAILVPVDNDADHLKTLATLAERFQQEQYVNALRKASSNQALFDTAAGETV